MYSFLFWREENYKHLLLYVIGWSGQHSMFSLSQTRQQAVWLTVWVSIQLRPTHATNQCYKQTNNAEEVLKKGDNIFMKLIFSCTNYQYCAHVLRIPWLIVLKGALEVTIRQVKPQLIAFSLSPPHQVGSTVTIITTLSLPSWQSIGSLTSLCSLGTVSHNLFYFWASPKLAPAP